MKKKKPHHEKEPNMERWLVSYADFITLLFAVFVTLYAMSQVDKVKTEQVIRSMEQAFGISMPGSSGASLIPGAGQGSILGLGLEGGALSAGKTKTRATTNDFQNIRKVLEEELKKVEEGKNTRFDISARGLSIILQDSHLFAPAEADLRPEAYPMMNFIAKILNQYVNPLSIEGFTDNLDIRSRRFSSNWELSSSRALSVLHFLVDRHQFNPKRLSITGHGANHPIGDNTTDEGRRQNRRVEIVILAVPNNWTEPW
ncbi:MAG: OmpA family protein [Deltaproteobacteria bacterium]|nr:OmpA family protein [Deltaproteobacteria bacterium]